MKSHQQIKQAHLDVLHNYLSSIKKYVTLYDIINVSLSVFDDIENQNNQESLDIQDNQESLEIQAYDEIACNPIIKHIYNGFVYINGTSHLLMEFKIMDNDKFLFKRVNFHCGWFLVDKSIIEKNNVLLGPIKLDLNLIKSGYRKIKDENYKGSIDGCYIEMVDNKDVIDFKNMPCWMIESLLLQIDNR